MKKLLATLSAVAFPLLSASVFALTEAQYQQYQMIQGQNVLFIETVAENPNISAILQTLEKAGYAEFHELPAGTANDVWCRIESKYQSSILWVECYETRPGAGISFHNEYNPAKSGYAGLPQFIKMIREETRRFAATKNKK